MSDLRSWGTASSPPPETAPSRLDRDDGWRQFDNSVNAVSFGFVATAILISMFLVMAIFERFLRPRSSSSSSPSSASPTSRADLEAVHVSSHPKLNHFPSPKTTVCSKEISVLMPGDEIPTFIAQPAPAPCLPEPIIRPLHQNDPCLSFASRSITGHEL